jgi:ABC-type lipoprotein release transport system permease subunit
MTIFSLAWSGIRYQWRAHLGAALGAALCSMVLTGSLLIGDSLRGTLREQAAARVGRVNSALVGGEHFFRSALAGEISSEAAPLLLLRGSATRADGSARLNQVQILGVDSRFWALAPASDRRELQPGDCVISAALAARLGLAAGDSLVVRVEKPSSFSKDAPLSGEEDSIEALRARIVLVADDSRFGRFAMHASQVPAASVFLPLEQLQQRLDVAGRANVILSAEPPEKLSAAAAARWTQEDASLEVRPLPSDAGFEVRSSKVFLSESLVKAIPAGDPSLTYFVNALRSGEKSTPYSMVSAAAPGTLPFLPADLAPDEMVVSDWLAGDLGVEAGGELEMAYLVMNAKRQFEERTRKFRIRAVEPLGVKGWDGSWMPDFPGLADAGNCRDWKPGFALDTTKIRDKDEAYWKEHKGAPKAFVSLQTAREMWANRWGAATSVRYNGGAEGAERMAALPAALSPGVSGVQMVALKQLAEAATAAPVDFAGLFFGFSIFLVAAALALIGLLFGLMVETRIREAGSLLAMGWSRFWVRALFLLEGSGVALLGAVLGAVLGVGYTRGVLAALMGVWSGATGGASLSFYGAPSSLVLGVLGSALMALLAMGWAIRHSWKRPVRELLAGERPAEDGARGSARSRGLLLLALVFLAAGAGLILSCVQKREVNPGVFFGGGALLLVAMLLICRVWLRRLSSGLLSSIGDLSRRNVGRRPGRSLAVAAVLASGAFLVLSVQVFRKEPPAGTGARHSGTGGFALIGELAAPVYEDLNVASVRDALGLPVDSPAHVVALRVREGEDASCLNLNRAVRPRLVGVPSAELEKLGAFRFVGKNASWAMLREQPQSADILPAVVDEDTLQWALQKKIGDEILLPDGKGGQLRVRVAGTLGGSILQGALLVDEASFVRAFPDAGGYRMFLMDVAADKIDPVRASWSRALQDRGLELRPAAERLAELEAVSNTYLAIFQVLGGLGVLLGAVGVGVVASRNVVERRAELALLEVGGWLKSQVRGLMLRELALLTVAGLFIGGVCAWLVTVPGQWIRGAEVSYGPLLAALALLGAVSLFAVRIALGLSLRGSPGEILRRE